MLVVRDAAAPWLRRALETGRKGAAIKSKYLTYRQLCQVKHAHPDVERFFVIEEDEDRGDDVFFRSENISVALGTELRGIAFDHQRWLASVLRGHYAYYGQQSNFANSNGIVWHA